MAATTTNSTVPHGSIPHAMPPLSNASRDPSSSFAKTSIITPHTLNLSLPYPPNADPFVDAAPYHLLLAEMPASLANSLQRAALRRKRLLEDIREAGLSLGDLSLNNGDEEQQELEARLEQVGEQVGARLAERISRDRPPLPTTLDVLKFLCKDFWIAVWDKQVDGLRTNHRGVYVLQDHSFKPLTRISSSQGSAAAAPAAKAQLAHSVGLLRGALLRMGISANLVAESPLSQKNPVGGSVSFVAGTGSSKDGNPAALSPAATTFHVRIATTGTSAGSGGASIGRPSSDRSQ